MLLFGCLMYLLLVGASPLSIREGKIKKKNNQEKERKIKRLSLLIQAYVQAYGSKIFCKFHNNFTKKCGYFPQ